MRLITLLFCLIVMTAFPAAAEEEKTPEDAPAQRELPFREDSGLTKAEYLISAGQYSAAIDTASDVIRRHPGSADAYAYRGYAYMKLGQKTQAAKDLKAALQLKPTHLGANKYLADIYLEDGDVARAIEQSQVIRMACGQMDCEELRALQRAIDQSKQGDEED